MPGGQFFVVGKGGGGIFTVVEKAFVPPVENWVSHFDNTEWAASTGSWDGSKWVGNPTSLTLSPIGTWADSYRPTKMRLVTNVGNLIFQVDDTDSNAIADAFFYVSLTPVTIDFSNNFDIDTFSGVIDSGTLNISSIEFLEE